MHPRFVILAATGLLVGTPAFASVVEAADDLTADGELWEEDPCDPNLGRLPVSCFEASDPTPIAAPGGDATSPDDGEPTDDELGDPMLDDGGDDFEDPMGPGGGVLLAMVGNTSFEANPVTGYIAAVVDDPQAQTRQIVRLLEPFKRGAVGVQQSLLSGAVEELPDGRTLVAITVQTFAPNGKATGSHTLRFDADTLEPTTGRKVVGGLPAHAVGAHLRWAGDGVVLPVLSPRRTP